MFRQMAENEAFCYIDFVLPSCPQAQLSVYTIMAWGAKFNILALSMAGNNLILYRKALAAKLYVWT